MLLNLDYIKNVSKAFITQLVSRLTCSKLIQQERLFITNIFCCTGRQVYILRCKNNSNHEHYSFFWQVTRRKITSRSVWQSRDNIATEPHYTACQSIPITWMELRNFTACWAFNDYLMGWKIIIPIQRSASVPVSYSMPLSSLFKMS